VKAGVVKDCTPTRFCPMGFLHTETNWLSSDAIALKTLRLLPPRRED
jgi:hypothetical protein